jgi:hypothetical protein
MDNPRSNTERQIELFASEMGELEAEAQRVSDINTRIQARSDQHFAEWEAELGKIQNPEIAARGQVREQQSRATLEAIRDSLDRADEVVSPYIQNLRDMKRFLVADSTSEGVVALTPVMRKTLQLEARAMKMLDEVIAHIDKVTQSVQ